MRIIVSVKNFYPPIGGAEKSIELLIKKLAEKHTVDVICSGSENKDVMWSGFPVHIRKVRKVPQPTSMPRVEWLNLFYETDQWRKIFGLELKKSKPELVITQLEFAPPTIEVAVKEDVPVILFIRSYEHFCPIGFLRKNPFMCNKKCWRCISILPKTQYIFIRKILNQHKMAFENAYLVIANSIYVKRVAKIFYNTDVEVSYPLINLGDYKTKKKEGKYLLLIGGSEHKGISILTKIAERMRNEQFMVIGKIYGKAEEKIKSLDNVKSFLSVNNMQEIYSQTKLLLMPRLWPEPFGRVVIEAGINGIPTISSNIGGLPESVGRGGVLINNYWDVNEWVKEINRIMDDKAFYDALSTNAEKHAKEFDSNKIYMDFKRIVKGKLGLDL